MLFLIFILFSSILTYNSDQDIYRLCGIDFKRVNNNDFSNTVSLEFTIDPTVNLTSDIYVEIESDIKLAVQIIGLLDTDTSINLNTIDSGKGRVYLKDFPLNCSKTLIGKVIEIIGESDNGHKLSINLMANQN